MLCSVMSKSHASNFEFFSPSVTTFCSSGYGKPEAEGLVTAHHCAERVRWPFSWEAHLMLLLRVQTCTFMEVSNPSLAVFDE